ncbi:putative Tartan, partial [Daphnia magna]
NRFDGPIEAFKTVSPLTHLDLSAAQRFLYGSVVTISTSPKVLPIVNLVMTNNALWNHLPTGLFHGLDAHLVRLDLSGNALKRWKWVAIIPISRI